MGIVSALALRIWRTNENARVAGKTLCFRLRVCFAREAALRMPVHHSCTPRLVRGPPLTSRLSVTGVHHRLFRRRAPVVGRSLAGSAHRRRAPKTVNKARFTCAADECVTVFIATYGVPGRARDARCTMPPKRAFGEGRAKPIATGRARRATVERAPRTVPEPRAMRAKTHALFFFLLRMRSSDRSRAPAPTPPIGTHRRRPSATRIANGSRVPSTPCS